MAAVTPQDTEVPSPVPLQIQFQVPLLLLAPTADGVPTSQRSVIGWPNEIASSHSAPHVALVLGQAPGTEDAQGVQVPRQEMVAGGVWLVSMDAPLLQV